MRRRHAGHLAALADRRELHGLYRAVSRRLVELARRAGTADEAALDEIARLLAGPGPD